MNGIKGFGLVFTAVMLCSSAWCQTAPTANRPLRRASGCLASIDPINKATDNMTPSATDDWAVLRSSQGKVRSHYPESFSDSDIRQIECLAWAEYREHNPSGQLDLDGFAKFASESFGGLKVRSRPDGAAIVVDDVSWVGPTNAQNMCKVGTRHIRLSKPGYYDATGDAIVKQGDWTVFDKDLQPKP